MSLKICYIWVNNFRNFENLGINLSSSKKFVFNSQNNYLKIESIDTLPAQFYGENISDVAGIIGKNGSGKSNAIELVCKVLKGAKTSINGDFLFVIEQGEQLICHYSFRDKVTLEANQNIQFVEYRESINPLKVVFFSNVFDERKNEFDSEVSDISVNYLYRKNTFFRKQTLTGFEKQIRLINSKVFSYLNIELPQKIQLTSKVWTNRQNIFTQKHTYGETYKSINELKKILRDRLREIRPDKKFIHLFRIGFFFETLNNLYAHRNLKQPNNLYSSTLLNNFINSLLKLRTEEISEKMIFFLKEEFMNLNFQEQLQLFDSKQRNNRNPPSERFLKQIEFLLKLKSTLSDLKLEHHTEGSRNRSIEYFTFGYNSKPSKKFISDFIHLFGHSRVFEINWLGISSGHKAYLNLFSSLYQELRYSRQPNLLLCIDEGDLYLHPMWQTEFFDRLLTILPQIYSGNIQLILTSHSPFLLSDIPNQSITVLDKNKIGSSINGIDLRNKTFGGNLYDLYSEPFFLDKKRTSDFAYNKIKKLIEATEDKTITNSEKEVFLKIANIIGDEIIQFQIKKLLNND
jgi:predicted ATPase